MERELVETRINIIQSKLDQGQVMAAQYEIEPLVRRYPENTTLLTLSGFIDMSLGNTERALVSLNEVYEIEEDASSALNLSSAYILAKNYPKALEFIQLGIEHHEEKPFVNFGRLWHNRGYIYEHMRNYSKALENYKQSLYHSPGYMPTLKQIAALYEKLGDSREASVYYRRYAYACPECYFPMSKLVYHLRRGGDDGVARSVINNYLKNSRVSSGDKRKAQDLLAAIPPPQMRDDGSQNPRERSPSRGQKSNKNSSYQGGDAESPRSRPSQRSPHQRGGG